MTRIEKTTALKILDSRGAPTVAVAVTLDDGTIAKAMVEIERELGQKAQYSDATPIPHNKEHVARCV